MVSDDAYTSACSDVGTGLFRVIFRNPNMNKTSKDWQVDMGTGIEISKMESEPSIEDLIDQQGSFFLLNANQLQGWHGIGRNYQYTSERDWVILAGTLSYSKQSNMPDAQGNFVGTNTYSRSVRRLWNRSDALRQLGYTL